VSVKIETDEGTISVVQKVTLQDIAEKLNVSHSTVSRAITGKPGLSQKVRQRVQETARVMGYKPNYFAKSLVSRKSGLPQLHLEVILCEVGQSDFFGSHFYLDLLRGVQEFAEKDGSAECYINYWDHSKESQILENKLLRYEQRHGAVLIGNFGTEFIRECLKRNIKIVLADQDYDDIEIDTVTSDNINAGMTAVQYLLEKGCQNIGWLGGPENVRSWTQRLDGVRAKLAKENILLNKKNFRNANSTRYKDIQNVFEAWISEGSIPDAIIVPSAFIALIAEQILSKHGLKHPEDMKIVCFDDQPCLNMMNSKPVRMATFPEEIGRIAMERLIKILRLPDENRIPQKILVPIRLLDDSPAKP